jgi:hypothetical protein
MISQSEIFACGFLRNPDAVAFAFTPTGARHLDGGWDSVGPNQSQREVTAELTETSTIHEWLDDAGLPHRAQAGGRYSATSTPQWLQ